MAETLVGTGAPSTKLRVQRRCGLAATCAAHAEQERLLPERVGETAEGANTVALCIGPGDWLIVSDTSDATALRQRVEGATRDVEITTVDLTDGLAVLEVSGPVARELLAKGCGLDLDPAGFSGGRCARTRFAQVSVVIHCRGHATFTLYVARSYASYLDSWLRDAAIEFQSGVR